MDASKSQRLTGDERSTIDAAVKETVAWFEASHESAELLELEQKADELQDKCKLIMTNYYKKNNSFEDEDSQDDAHDELWFIYV